MREVVLGSPCIDEEIERQDKARFGTSKTTHDKHPFERAAETPIVRYVGATNHYSFVLTDT